MKAIVLIPARLASTRLPGKPLADIAGLPMIVRVWQQAVAAGVGPVVVAAGEREIADAIIVAVGKGFDVKLIDDGILVPKLVAVQRGDRQLGCIDG